MKELLWKDFRLNRSVLLVTAVILAALYTIGGIIVIHATWPQWPLANDWADLLVAYGTVTLFGTCPITGMLGGKAMAQERADRSAFFLAYLPPTRKQILVSKFLVAAGIAAIIWAWALLSVYVLAPWLSTGHSNIRMPFTITQCAALCVLTFGVGWLVSAYASATLAPILVAICSPGAVSMLMEIKHLHKWDILANFLVGTLAFAAGCWAYCRRVEP